MTVAPAPPAFATLTKSAFSTEAVGCHGKFATQPDQKRWAGLPRDLGKIVDRGVIALMALTVASLLLGSYATASNSRELLPVVIVTAD